jgi:hypothetical protein
MLTAKSSKFRAVVTRCPLIFITFLRITRRVRFLVRTLALDFRHPASRDKLTVLRFECIGVPSSSRSRVEFDSDSSCSGIVSVGGGGKQAVGLQLIVIGHLVMHAQHVNVCRLRARTSSKMEIECKMNSERRFVIWSFGLWCTVSY